VDDSRFLFTDLTDEARSVKPSYYFMMRSLLHSRVDVGDTSEAGNEEEDVNVYLAHLLQSFSDPEYLEGAKPYLHRYDHEVFGRLSRSTDARLKYRIYKTNADFLLISIGIFDNPSQTLLNRLPGSGAAWHRDLEPTEEAIMGRGRTYYQFAYNYSQLVYRQKPAISEVLEKLSSGFDRYTRILAHLRGEYMDIIHELSRGEVYHLERTVNSQQKRQLLRDRQDAFLDAYAEWKRDPSDMHRDALDDTIVRLRELDPDFRFDPDQPGEPGRPSGREIEGPSEEDTTN
jgi:hypothetical protein